MSAIRGRNLGSFGQAFTPVMVDGKAHPPTGGMYIRGQGVPTHPGYRDRPWKWNVFIPWFLTGLELLRRLLEHHRS